MNLEKIPGNEDHAEAEKVTRVVAHDTAERVLRIKAALASKDLGAFNKPDQKIEIKSEPKTIDDLRKKAELEGGMLLFHGGLPDDTQIDAIDLDRPGTQQNKKGRSYGGFYLTDDSSKNWTDQYARERNGNVHGFLLDPATRVLEITDRNIDRLSAEQRTDFAAAYDILKGKDLLGRAQYVLLNKDIIKELGIEKLKLDNE